MPSLKSIRPDKIKPSKKAAFISEYSDPIFLRVLGKKKRLSLAIVIRKKAGKAHFRNKLKRWTREEFFKYMGSGLRPGFYLVIFDKKKIPHTKRQIRSSLNLLFAKHLK